MSCGDVELTYEDTWDRCRRLVGGLRGFGLGEGDRVAVVAPNCHHYLELYQAVPGAGMVLVRLNQRHTEAELRYALDDTGAAVMFAGRDVGSAGDSMKHVIDLGDEYEQLLASRAPADIGDDLPEDTLPASSTQAARPGLQRSDAHPPQPGRQRVQLPGVRAVPARDVLADRRPVVPSRRLCRRVATVWHGGRHVVLPVFDPAAALDLIECNGFTDTLIVPSKLGGHKYWTGSLRARAAESSANLQRAVPAIAYVRGDHSWYPAAAAVVSGWLDRLGYEPPTAESARRSLTTGQRDPAQGLSR